MRIRSLALLLLALLVAGRAQGEYALEFIADFNIPTGVAFFDVSSATSAPTDSAPAAAPLSRAEVLARKSSGALGGLSALAYDGASGLLYALSDSSKPTLFVFEFALTADALRLTPRRSISLTGAGGEPLEPWTLDPEGLALTAEGHLWIASEGYVVRDPPVDPGVFRFDRDGRLNGKLVVPDHYRAKKQGERMVGVRSNRGFESLSLSPSGQRLFVATESPLVQHDDACDSSGNCTAPLLHYGSTADGFRLLAEHTYRIDAPIAPDGFDTARAGAGLAEVLAVDDQTLFTLERGGVVAADGRYHQTALVFQVEIPVSEKPAEGPLAKRLVLDLDSIKHRFSEGYRSLDNFEGMCFGPVLGDGGRTILLVSDNNYSERQRTTFLAFRLVER